jgi:glycosyltransferase involved in cell wall biosynthesis
MCPIIYADLRCLQDYGYRVRGIGHHLTALIRTRKQSSLSDCKLVALTDPQASQLPNEYAPLIDEVTCSLNPVSNGAPAVFIDGTPMTHDTRFTLRFLAHPAFLSAAVVHDFIPLDWPGYLPTLRSRIDYLAKMARLRKFKLFLPVSEYTAWRTSELLGIPRDRMHVTGSSVRRSLYCLRDSVATKSSPADGNEPYFAIVIASDPRKNAEVAVKAVRHLNLLYSRRIPLKIIGHFDEAFKRRLLALAAHPEGRGFVEFHYNIPDEELVSILSSAVATIVPSHIEGFSLPVVEASVCRCPVIASTCAAHLELVEQPEALFQSDDSVALSEKLDALLNNPSLRASLAASQAYLADKFHENSVGERFWSAIEAAVNANEKPPRAPRWRKPRLAFLSPYPPDQSSAARYTAMAMRTGEKLFHSDLYSDTPRPLIWEDNIQDASPVSIAPLMQSRYHSIISVIGNEICHGRIFDVFRRYGGPCILHDVQLADMLLHSLGQERFLELAAKRLGRFISNEEAGDWLREGNPPCLFLDPIIKVAKPLIVHTAPQQELLKTQYGIHADILTCCPSVFFEQQHLMAAAIQTAREHLGVPGSGFLISSFGAVDRFTGMESIIPAVELLRSWSIPAELYFVGPTESHKAEIDRIAAIYGISNHVHAGSGLANSAACRNFLIASDAAVQVRLYGFGRTSTPLADCISAGLPCVANSEMAQACDGPSYVSTVPDRFSPLQIAEQLVSVWEQRRERASHAEERIAYVESHNFDYYVKRLTAILGIA